MSQTQIYDVFKKPVIWLLVLSDNNDKKYTIILLVAFLLALIIPRTLHSLRYSELIAYGAAVILTLVENTSS